MGRAELWWRRKKECAITHLGRRLVFQILELDRVWITYVGVRPYPTGFEILSASKSSNGFNAPPKWVLRDTHGYSWRGLYVAYFQAV